MKDADIIGFVGFSIRTDVPVVMEVESVGVVSWIQPVVSLTEVRYEAVWVSGYSINSTISASPTSSNDEVASTIFVGPTG